MIPHLSHVMTLANSIIGVSVLAMPFCFKQCGIVLATLVLLTSCLLSRLACHFLIKSAVMSRRRNFEFLAFHAFGRTGKFFVELFIIGFLLGTCIAFFVVVGDLGPQIIAKILNKRPEDIRTSVLVTTAMFIVLPLGLLRNIDSLSSVCTATIGFYLCLVLKVICESTTHIFLGDWYDRVFYWRPAGILQCLPIFSMALFCQTQLFEIYEAIPNVCLEKMNQVVRGALNICTVVYLCVGFFGYVAFCTQPFTGNILMSFEPSLTSDVIKMGFVFSVAFSFPLVIFPCRASLNSLLFRRGHTHEPTNNYIPEVRFRCLTLTIVSLSLGTGILTPNIEFLLGIVGSTIGVMICLIFPAAFFIAISTKNTNERLVAQAILFFGMWIMVLGTYANIYAMEDSSNARLLITTGKPIIDQFNDMPFKKIFKDDFPIDKINIHQVKEKPEIPKENHNEKPEISDIRREPPIPVELSLITERSLVDTKNSPTATLRPDTLILQEVEKKVEELVDIVKSMENKKINDESLKNVESPVQIKNDEKNNVDETLRNLELSKNDNLIDSDAIKKEERELEAAAVAADEKINIDADAKREKLLETLEKHKVEQLEMMQEQKKLLKDIKEQKQELELEKIRLANEQIKNENNALSNEPKIQRKIVVEPSKIDKTNNDKIQTIDVKNLSNNETVVNTKNNSSIVTLINEQESHGPILNALTNWTLKKSIEIENVINEKNSVENSSKIRKNHENIGILRPIALKMNDDTKKIEIMKEKMNFSITSNKSLVEDTLATGRDILEHREFVKRDKREISRDDAIETRNIDVNDDAKDSSKFEDKKVDQCLVRRNNEEKFSRERDNEEKSGNDKELEITRNLKINENGTVNKNVHVDNDEA